MIQQNHENVKPLTGSNSQFIAAMKELQISRLLHESNIRKDTRTLKDEKSCEKRTTYETFRFLIMLVFQGCNLYQYTESKKRDIACSRSTYHRFLSDPHFNWKKFITQLAAKVIGITTKLTASNRFRAFVLDDSFIGRKRSKKVELMAHIFDHVSGKTQRGFNLLTLGWTDGYSFFPVAFNMLSSAKASARMNEINEKVDKRTIGYRNRKEAIQQKPNAAISMIKTAIEAGINASCVLMDTWFTNEPFIKQITDLGLDVIGMLKDNKQRYRYHGRLFNLKELVSCNVVFKPKQECLGSIVVRTNRERIPVKLVFVRNRNKHDEYLIILSTNCLLSDEEIVRRYGYRWSIECCFKVSKSLLKLGKEFQPVNYDTTVSSTALVFTRFILLEWIRRKENDLRTINYLFYETFEEVKDIELADALGSLLSILEDCLTNADKILGERTRKQLLQWYISQPIFIQKICEHQMIKAGFIKEQSQTAV